MAGSVCVCAFLDSCKARLEQPVPEDRTFDLDFGAAWSRAHEAIMLAAYLRRDRAVVVVDEPLAVQLG